MLFIEVCIRTGFSIALHGNLQNMTSVFIGHYLRKLIWFEALGAASTVLFFIYIFVYRNVVDRTEMYIIGMVASPSHHHFLIDLICKPTKKRMQGNRDRNGNINGKIEFDISSTFVLGK